MPAEPATPERIDAFRTLVARLLIGGRPTGRDFDACRAILRSPCGNEERYHALCMLLEGALADPALSIDDTRTVVRLLQQLARLEVRPEQVL
jgi:hypothetical protein